MHQLWANICFQFYIWSQLSERSQLESMENVTESIDYSHFSSLNYYSQSSFTQPRNKMKYLTTHFNNSDVKGFGVRKIDENVSVKSCKSFILVNLINLRAMNSMILLIKTVRDETIWFWWTRILILKCAEKYPSILPGPGILAAKLSDPCLLHSHEMKNMCELMYFSKPALPASSSFNCGCEGKSLESLNQLARQHCAPRGVWVTCAVVVCLATLLRKIYFSNRF